MSDSIVLSYDTELEEQMIKSLKPSRRSKKLYIGIPFPSNVTILLEKIKTIQYHRKSQMALLISYWVYEKMQNPLYTNLKKLFTEVDSYVSATMDHSYHYKFTNIVGIDDCFSRSIQLIIDALNRAYQQSIGDLCSNYYNDTKACLTDPNFYGTKKRILTNYVKNIKEASQLKVGLRYTYGFYSYKDIFAYPLLSYYRQSPIAAMNDRSMLVKTAHLRTVTFLQSPFVMVRNLSLNDNCNDDGYGLECFLMTMAVDNSSRVSEKQKMCCFGLSIDVLSVISRLEKYSKEFKVAKTTNDDILITNYGLDIEVYDRRDYSDGNGVFLAQATLNNELLDKLLDFTADITLGSHIVVSKSNHNVSYLTKPYLSASIALMISKKGKLARYSAFTGFLDPFAWSMWVGIFLTIQISAIATVIYEWHSPYGLTPRGRNRYRIFSFSSALTLCWSILFSHNVATKSPKCWSSRFLINVYACFCVIFLASYTANLAAYMVGEKSLREITGFHDKQISNGNIRLGTIVGSGTEFYLRTAQVHQYKFIRLFINPNDTLTALRKGIIDAFVYDIEALQFYKRANYADQFEIVGKPFAQVSYAIALSKNLENFGEDLSNFLSRVISADGFQKFMDQRVKLWTREMSGVDKLTLLESNSMKTENFAGPLLLFCFGLLLGFITLIFECITFYFALPYLRNCKNKEWCLSISQRLHRHLYVDLDYNKFAYTARHSRNVENLVVDRLNNHHRLSDSSWVNSCNWMKYIESLQMNDADRSFSASKETCLSTLQRKESDFFNIKEEKINDNNLLNMAQIKYLHMLLTNPGLINESPTVKSSFSLYKPFLSDDLSIFNKVQSNNAIPEAVPFKSDYAFGMRRSVSTQTTLGINEDYMRTIGRLTDEIRSLAKIHKSLLFLLSQYQRVSIDNIKYSTL